MRHLKVISITICLSFQLTSFSQKAEFEKLTDYFVKEYVSLNIAPLQISYVATLNGIKTIEDIINQEKFFFDIKEKLSHIDTIGFSNYEKIDYEILAYQTKLNLERVQLEKQWKPQTLDENQSIYSIPNGKKWYAHILKKWVDVEVEPEAMFEFGLKEIEKVKAKMTLIQKESGLSSVGFQKYLNDQSFFISDVNTIQKRFESIKQEVTPIVDKLFPFLNQIPAAKIQRGTNSSLAHVPAFYDNGTFYYNYFEEPFNTRQFGWIFVHEAIPGHHYQIMVNTVVKRTEVQNLFWYPGYSEGWGAYIEHLGKELGVYKTIYDEYGKWEWDLIRSVRVALDVGINYYGWSDEKAFIFWKQHIKNQDKVAKREISRMKRWPAQVITYKYGAKKLLDLLNIAKQKEAFSFKKFHSKILMHGDIPLTILNKQ